MNTADIFSTEQKREIGKAYFFNHDADNDIGHAFDENFENGITYMRKINAKLADAYKELLSLICEIIIESDGVIAESEIAEVKRLNSKRLGE